MMDVWSRKIVGWDVYEVEAAAQAAALFGATCRAQGIAPAGLVLHADSDGPMKGATMVVTLERLGVLASFSRPGVSNDQSFSESLFRTLKYRPEYPAQSFADLAAARRCGLVFVRWYNTAHRHRAIRLVTPADRPDRWSGATRNWTPITTVALNPEHAGESPSMSIAV